MQKTNLKKYAQLKLKIEELEAERNTLKISIMKEMQKEAIEKAETDFGIFTIAKRPSWTYTDKVGEMKDKLKLREIYEQKKGLAKKSETEYLVFNLPKIDSA